MDEQAGHTSSKPTLPDRTWSWLVVLLLLTTAMRSWQVCHTEVVSRDTLTYIRVAWQLEHGNTLAVLRHSPHHPGYPATIVAMSWLIRPFTGNDLVLTMQLSAQVASAAAAILLIIPMFLLGREWFDQRTCFWAALLFQCLPACGRVLGDGLSESLFLLCASTSLLFATRGLRTGSPVDLACASLAAGAAYLTRPEGAALVIAAGVVLLLMQALPSRHCSWRSFGVRLASLALPVLMLAVPYMLVIGHFSAKMAATNILKVSGFELPEPSQLVDVQPLPVIANPLAVWWLDAGESTNRVGWSIHAFGWVLVRAFYYVLWLPTLVGLWFFRKRLTRTPGVWIMGVVNLILLAALFRVTFVMGYVSERHLMLLVLCLSYWTVVGLEGVAQRLGCQRWTWMMLVVVAGVPMVKSLEPLHDNRLGYRTAGYWMAKHTNPDDSFYDPFGWTYYYAGRMFHEPMPGDHETTESPRYVLLEESGNKHPHLWGWGLANRLITEGHGQVVQTWNLPGGKILLYQVTLPPMPGLRFTP